MDSDPLLNPEVPGASDRKAAEPQGLAMQNPWQATWEYWVDAWQRTILFWDVLRQRSDQYYAQKAKAVPHVLIFDAELVLDGRTFDRPVNYGLVRIKPPEGVVIDPKKRPFVVVDPRAGHGPGIGGFKADSELGVAMHAGHPCYFVGFSPDPMPGQTIEDIMRAEAVFLEKVIALHPDADGKPCVIGNCQAGWAVMMLAAIRPDLFGPIIIAGSPLSYWAGIEGQNPMRYTGGLMGGSWLTALTGDLGARQVRWRQSRRPTSRISIPPTLSGQRTTTCGPRSIPKGRASWNSRNGGAATSTSMPRKCSGSSINCSSVTGWPPPKSSPATGCGSTCETSARPSSASAPRVTTSPRRSRPSAGSVDLYQNDEDILAQGQTIVYAIHESVGHLGIFVSGGVARKEHDEFASNIDLIDVLPPGLYEAVMTRKAADAVHPELVSGDWIVRFERRTLNDIRAIVQPDPENERRFAAVRRVSEINLGLYRTLLQPFVRAFASEQIAEWLHRLHPSRTTVRAVSDRNPLMQHVAQLAEQVRQQRRPPRPTIPCSRCKPWSRKGSSRRSTAGAICAIAASSRCSWRSTARRCYRPLVGLSASDERPRRLPGIEPERIAFIQERIAELKARIAEGGMREAAIRSMVYIGMAGPGVDERAFNQLRQMRAKHGGLTLEEFKRDAPRTVLRPDARPGRRAGRDSKDASRRQTPGRRRWRRFGPSWRRPVRRRANGRSGWHGSRPCWEIQPSSARSGRRRDA